MVNLNLKSPLPQAIDLVRGPCKEEAENEDTGDFDCFHLGLPYQAACLYT